MTSPEGGEKADVGGVKEELRERGWITRGSRGSNPDKSG